MKSRSTIKYSFSEQLKLAAVLIISCLTLIYTDWLRDWDQNIYDVQMRASSKPVPDDIVIIAIDETSLNDFGRWPWPRNIHALLIDRLTELGAKTIVLDIIVSEADRTDSEADKALANSISNAGNVILPVLVEQTRLGSQLKETLPLPILVEAGASLGHVHIELDADGIARSMFLYEGLGKPHWPHISLAALSLNSNSQIIDLPDTTISKSPYSWHRAEQRLIPFLGPPGHIQRISYGDVIKELVNKESIEGKTIFVGVTATGLGDFLPTPVSGLTHPMPGIEINANIFASLRNNSHIQLIQSYWRIIISILFIILPVIFFPRISPRAALILSISLIAMSGFLSYLLLHLLQIWFAPLAVMITLILSYPLWSWRRLEFTTRYLDSQIKLLSDESGLIPDQSMETQLSTVGFLSEILACDGWGIFDKEKSKQNGTDDFAQLPPKSLRSNEWTKHNSCYWLKMIYEGEIHYLGLQLLENGSLSHEELQFLEDFKNNLSVEQKTPRKDTLEIIEHQILEVQSATARLRAMRRFVSASLDQMADAVIISSALGEIILYNQQAEQLLGKKSLDNKSFLDNLSQNKLNDPTFWKDRISEVLTQRKTIHLQASHKSEKDLLIQITPLITSGSRITGLIASFSDITDIKDAERKRHEYINFLSHDLRSPLSSALALIELATTTKNSINKQNINRLKQYTERALGLTENFVQIARADNIDQINFHEFDLLSVILNASDQLWELASEKHIAIDIQSDLKTAECLGDANLLERAFINIFSNAIKYSPNDTLIKTTLEKVDNSYHCSITDHGYGIEENEIPHLFTRFHRSSQMNQQNIPGIGLGLTFVKTVIEGHKGSIHVESVLNKGSTFRLVLPTSKH